jgi:general stress protein 26
MFKGFMCQGDIEIVKDETVKDAIWHDDWNMYYPGGKDGGDYTVLMLKPVYIKSYTQLQLSDLQLTL